MPDKKIDREAETMIGISELRARLAAGARLEDAKIAGVELDKQDIRDQVALGVVEGMAMIVHDEQLVKAFGKKLYEQVKEHANADMNVWFGKRFFVLAVGMIVVWGVGILIRNGAFK